MEIQKKSYKNFLIPIVLTILCLGVIGVYATYISDTENKMSYSLQNNSGYYVQGGDGNYLKAFTKTADVVVCRGTNLFDDQIKRFTCDVVCKSTDNDCANEIQLAYNSLEDGTNEGKRIFLKGYVFPVTSTINITNGVVLYGKNGLTNGGTTWNNYNVTTSLYWNGADNGIMFNVSGYKTAWGFDNIQFRGNNLAGYGIKKEIETSGNRAKRLHMNRIQFSNFKIAAIDLGCNVDDTIMNDIFIETSNVGITGVTTEVKIFGGAIFNNSIGVLMNGSTCQQSITFDGFVFSQNNIDFMLANSYLDYLDNIRCTDCWIEDTKQSILKMTNPMRAISIDFVSSSIGSENCNETFNMSLASANSSLNFIGGRSYVDYGNGTIFANSNVSISFINHGESGDYFIYGTPSIIQLLNNKISIGTNRDTNNIAIYGTTPSFFMSRTAGGTASMYLDTNLNFIGAGSSPDRTTKFYDKIQITNLTSGGYSVVCATPTGVLCAKGSGSCTCS